MEDGTAAAAPVQRDKEGEEERGVVVDEEGDVSGDGTTTEEKEDKEETPKAAPQLKAQQPLPQVRPGVQRQVCRFWRGTEGSCQRGDACRFLHQTWDKRDRSTLALSPLPLTLSLSLL
jgi:hypothetical protein